MGTRKFSRASLLVAGHEGAHSGGHGGADYRVSTRPVHPNMARINLRKAPSTSESLVPVWGPLRESIAAFANGHPVMGGVDAVFAAADVVPVGKGFAWAARGVKDAAERVGEKGIAHAFERDWEWEAARARHRAAGLIKPGQHGHHGVIPHHRWGDYVPKFIKNSSVNIKGLDPLTHMRIHHRVGDLPRLPPIQRTWIGTPEAVKGAATVAVDHIASVTVGRPKEGRDVRR